LELHRTIVEYGTARQNAFRSRLMLNAGILNIKESSFEFSSSVHPTENTPYPEPRPFRNFKCHGRGEHEKLDMEPKVVMPLMQSPRREVALRLS